MPHRHSLILEGLTLLAEAAWFGALMWAMVAGPGLLSTLASTTG